MDLVAKASGGANIVARPQARPNWYPTATLRPAQVAVYWRYVGEPPAAARLVGLYAPGQEVSFPYNPVQDRNVILSTISIAANGNRSAREIADAHEETLVFQRETAAPTFEQVKQFGDDHASIPLAVEGFTKFALKRRVRIADDVGMSVNLEETEFVAEPGEVLPRVQYLDRTDSGTGTRTVFVTIAHSSGGEYGAESDPIEITFADDTGAGGSTGEGDPFGQVRFDA